MKGTFTTTLLCALLLQAGGGAAHARERAPHRAASASPRLSTLRGAAPDAYASSSRALRPLQSDGGMFFVENRGQFADMDGKARSDIRYVLIAGAMRVYVRSTGLSFVQTEDRSRVKGPDHEAHDGAGAIVPRDTGLYIERTDLNFLSSNPRPTTRGEEAADWYANFYTAGAPNGVTGLTPLRRVVLENVWNGIDLVLRIEQERLKYEFIVRPEGRVQDIAMRYSENATPSLLPGGGLEAKTGLGALAEESPQCWVQGGAALDGRFVIDGRQIGFQVGAAPRGSTIVIDPTLSWSTYIGTSGTDEAGAVDVDANDDVLLCGSCSGSNFPTTTGVYQYTRSAASYDGFIIKFSAGGSRIWATYYAGASAAVALRCDGDGNQFITGCTNYSAFPVSSGAFQGSLSGGYDAFLIKMLPDGQRGWATFCGGTSADGGAAICIDQGMRVYVAGQTSSTNFPVSSGAFQGSNAGGADAFIMKFDSSGQRLWSTYAGSSTTNWAHGCTIDSSGNLAVWGTTGTGFPVTSGALATTFPGGSTSAFMIKFDSSGSRLWATYFGSSTIGYDVDALGDDLVVTGYINATSGAIPVTSGAFQTTKGGADESYIARINASGSAVVWATYLGGSGNEHTSSVRIRNANIHVTGCTFSSNFPVTTGAYQTAYGGNEDRFVAEFSPGGQRCYVSFIGGTGIENCWSAPPVGERTEHSAAVASNGDFFISGSTSGNFPTTTGAFRTTAYGGSDGFLMRFQLDCSGMLSINAGNDTAFCAGGSAVIGRNAVVSPCHAPVTYSWSPATGLSATNIAQPTASPTTTTTYTVTVTDNSNCVVTDDVTITVTSLGATITPNSGTLCPGGSLLLQANTGTGYTYMWFRNGSVITGANGPDYTATQSGNYRVRIANSSGCFDTSAVATISAGSGPGATITPAGPTSFCVGGSVMLDANTGSGLTYVWQRDLATISGATGSSYLATIAGSYRVIVTNGSGCKDTSAAVTVTIHSGPGATLSAAGPTTFCDPGSVVLNANTGSGYTYVWQRDNATISGASGSSHTASVTGVYRVIVTNSNGCSDTSNTINVTVNPRPGATISPGSGTLCAGGSLVLSANTGTGYTFTWFYNGAVINGATGSTYTATQTGGYRVRVVNSFGCFDTSAVMTITPGTGPGATITPSGSVSFCVGGNVTLNANTGGGLTYIWQRNATTISGATGSSYLATLAGSYRVIVSNAGGCKDTSASITVTILSGPGATITAAGPTTFCEPGSVVLNANTGSGLTYEWQRDLASISGATSASYTASQSGGYRVIVTNANGCSDTSNTITVTAVPRPGATISPAGPVALCAGEVVTLVANSGTGFTYQWQRDLSNITGATLQALNVSTAGSYRVIVVNSTGCRDTSAAVVVTVNPKPVAGLTAAGPLIFCEPGQVLLNATPTSGVTYAWLRSGTLLTGVSGASYAATTSGLYRVIVTNSFGCPDTSAPINVTVHPRPLADLSGGPTPLCEGETAFLGVTSGAGYTYTWQKDLITIAGATLPTYRAKQAGSYRVIVTSSLGCADTSAPFVLVVNPRPKITCSAAGPTTFCEPGSVTLNATTTPAGLNPQWRRDGADIPGATGGSYVVTESGSYNVIVTDLNGCSDTSASIAVTVHPLPVALIDPPGPLSFCEGANVLLKATTGAGFTYQWQRNATTINGANSAAYTASTAGSFRVVISSANGCTDTSDAVDLTVNPMPNQRIEGKTSICPNTLASYFVSNGTGFDFQWTVVNGTIQFGQSTPKIDMQWGKNEGLGEVRVRITNSATGCWRDTVLKVTITTALRPVIVSDGNGILCEGDSIRLDAGAGYATYEWSRGGTPLGITTRTIVVTLPGSYTVLVTDAGGCSGTSNPFVVTVNPMPVLTLSAKGPTILCTGERVTLEATSNPPASYTWFRNGGEILGVVGSSFVATQPGAYHVSALTQAGCTARSDTLTIVIKATPVAVAEATGSTILCAGDSAVLKAKPDTGVSYQWLLGDTPIAGATGKTCKAGQSGNYRVIVADLAAGCKDTSGAVSVAVRPALLVRIDGPTTLCSGDIATLVAGGSSGSLLWSTGESSPSISVTKTGKVSLTVTDSAGCKATASVTVTVYPKAILSVKGSRSICKGGQTVLDAQAGFAEYRWSTNETTQRVVIRAPGVYWVSVKDSNGCTARDTLTVIESDKLTPTITGKSVLCPGGSATLEADSSDSYGRYIWTLEADTSTYLGTQRRFVATGPGRYMVRVVDKGGCAGNAVIDVTQASVTPRIAGRMSVCTGHADTLDAGAGYVAYAWSTGGSSRLLVVTAPGTYTVNVTDTNGCTWKATALVTERLVTPSIAGSKTYCTGSAARLSAQWPGAVSYEWSTGDRTRDVTLRITGPIWLKVVDSSGCEGTVIDTLRESSTLTPSITGTRAFCAGRSTTLDAGPDLLWYRWSGPDTTQILAMTRTFEVSVAGTYVVRIADSSGCQGIDTLVVAQFPGPSAVIGGDSVLCAGGGGTLRVTKGLASYEWSTGERADTLAVTQPGSFWVRVTNANGCVDTLRVNVTVSSLIPITVAGAAGFCAGSVDTLDAGAGYTRYVWSTTDSTVVLGNGRTLAVMQAGTYVVRVTTTAGCAGLGRITVTEYPLPAPVIAQQGDTLQCGVFVSYQWMRDGADMPGATLQQIVATATGRYVVRVTDANGCTGISPPVDIQGTVGTARLSLQCLAERERPAGSMVNVPLQLDGLANAPAGSATTFTAVISTNPRVAYPLFAFTAPDTAMGRTRMLVRGSRPASLLSGTLLELPFEVLWGDTPCTEVRVDSLRWDDGTVTDLRGAVCEICATLCYEGGARLFRADGKVSLANRPNPFNASTIVEYEVIEYGATDVSVYDLMGRRVATLVHGTVAPGRYVVPFDAGALPSGMYVCVLLTPSEHRTLIMEVLK